MTVVELRATVLDAAAETVSAHRTAAWLAAFGAAALACGACTATSYTQEDAGEPDALVDAGDDGGGPCGAPLETGKYALSIVPIVDFNVGVRLELPGDGSFSGHDGLGRYGPAALRCDGTLAATEADRLTNALDAADIFCRTDLAWCEHESDFEVFDVGVRTLDGARTHRVCLARCNYHRDEALQELFEAATAPFRRLSPSECSGPAYVERARTDACWVMRP